MTTTTVDLLDVLAADPATADVPVAALLDVAPFFGGEQSQRIALSLGNVAAATMRIALSLAWGSLGPDRTEASIDRAFAAVALARCRPATFAAIRAEVTR